MKVAVFGATGRAGSRIVTELLARGHQVIAVARDSQKKPADAPGLTTKIDDLSDIGKTTEVMKGADAVISAYAPPPDNTDALVEVTKNEIEAIRGSGTARLLMVGGAGVLEVAPGVSLIESGHLPAEWQPIARAHAKALEVLRASDIDWTYLSPAAYFDPGTRTGKFRIGDKNLLSDEKGESKISMEDYAIAMVNELESPRHRRQSFCVAY